MADHSLILYKIVEYFRCASLPAVLDTWQIVRSIPRRQDIVASPRCRQPINQSITSRTQDSSVTVRALSSVWVPIVHAA